MHDDSAPQRLNGSLQTRDTRVPVEAGLLPALFGPADGAMLAVDAQGAVTGVTESAGRLLGYTEDELLGKPLHETLHAQHPDGRRLPREECALFAALVGTRPAFGADEVLIRADGTLLPVEWAFAPTVIAALPVGGVVALQAVDSAPTDVQHMRAVLAEQTNVRLAVLADVSEALADADLSDALQALADLVVPRLADWVVVDVVDEDTGRLHRAALTHRDPALQQVGRSVLGRLPDPSSLDQGSLAQVLRGAPTQHTTVFADPAEAPGPLGAARLALFALLGAAEAITAPLKARRRILGAVTLVRTDPERPFLPADVAFTADLGRRAATAVDTAYLLRRSTARAEQLQRALLPVLPCRVGGVEIGTTYRPAGDAAQVGGDWYDAFCVPDGGLALVVGDVAGHDLKAAGTMGSVRHKLRAVAADRATAPSDVLRRLDVLLQHFGTLELATAVYAQLSPGERTGWRLTWSNAGHPPPLLLTAEGAPAYLAGDADLPLGVADLPRHDHSADVPAGSTVVLYTDGLVERPGASLSDGLDVLRREAGGIAHLPPDQLARTLVARVTPHLSDDIAVLAARVPGGPGQP